jgi:hypothetical protein
VTPASIGIKTDKYTKRVAHGTDLHAANDHQGALAAFRINPISAHALAWLGVVLSAPGHRDHPCKIDGGRSLPSPMVHATRALARSQS